MPRMNILNTVEREAFNSPPVFSSFQRKQYFDFPSKLRRFGAASAIRPTSLALYSAQATSKPRGGSSHQALSTRGISSMWRASSSPERRRSTSPILAPTNVTSTRSGRSMVSGPAILRHPASCLKRSLAWCDPRLNPRSSSGAVSMFWFVKRLKCQVTRGWGDDTKVRILSGSRSCGDARALSNSSWNTIFKVPRRGRR
jgi:hypothetical protein